MYHRVCRIDPPGNVTESVVMFYLDDSFFFLSDWSFWKCYIVVNVHVLLRLLRSVRLNIPWMFLKNGTQIMIRGNAFYLGAFHIRHSFT